MRDAEEIKEHRYFEKINWEAVYNKKIPPPKLRGFKNVQLYNHPRMFQPDDQEIDKKDLPGWSFINNEEF